MAITKTNNRMIDGSVVNVLDYGVKNDGTDYSTGDNNHTRLQSAISDLTTAGGGTLYFPSGTYLIDSQIDINTTTGIHLVGAGRDATIIKYGGTFTPGSTFNFIKFDTATACSISSLTVNCDASTNASEPARSIVIFESQQINIVDVKCNNYTVGAVLAYRNDNNPNLQKIFIDKCQFYGVTSEAEAGIVLADCDESIVSNTYVKNGTFFGIELKNSCKYSTVADCICEDTNAAFHIGFQATTEFPDVDGGGASFCTFENCIAQGGQGSALHFARANKCVARNILIDKQDIAPAGSPTIWTDGKAVLLSGSLYCDVECAIFNVNSGVDYAININSDDCNVTVSNFKTVLSTKFARFAGSRDRINLNILYGDTVYYDTKDLLQDDADSTTNHVYQKRLTDLRLQSTGTLYDYRRYTGAEGHTGGSNYERITTTSTDTDWQLVLDGSAIIRAKSGVKFSPGSDNTISLGLASERWSEVFAGAGTINTSDRNEKEDIQDLSEAERRVATAIKGLIKKFKFKGRIRTHVGVIAQDVEAAFTAEGLDASTYGMFCSDTFEDENGATVTRLGIRYEELLAFVISAL